MNYRETIGTNENPLTLKTPPLSSEYTMHVDEKDGNEILVCTVGQTILHYDISCINDLHEMLKKKGDWILLGAKDEKVETQEGTIEHWGRSGNNPFGGWYGLKKNFRGRFAVYVRPLMEHLGLVELQHERRGNKMRAI